MGGRGSGGHNSKGKLRDVRCARLDVHELARDGKLTLGKRGRLFGTVWFEVAGGPDAQRLMLEFPIRSASGERLDPLRQTIVSVLVCAVVPNASAAGQLVSNQLARNQETSVTAIVSALSPPQLNFRATTGQQISTIRVIFAIWRRPIASGYSAPRWHQQKAPSRCGAAGLSHGNA
jgi:hypothetical protein